MCPGYLAGLTQPWSEYFQGRTKQKEMLFKEAIAAGEMDPDHASPKGLSACHIAPLTIAPQKASMMSWCRIHTGSLSFD